MANIGDALVISSAPLVDRVQAVQQGQGGTANPHIADAMVRKAALTKQAVQPSNTPERVAVRDDRPKKDQKDKNHPDDEDDADEESTARKHIDITA